MNYKKIRSNFYLKLFIIFIGYSLFTEILGFLIGAILRINSHFIYNSWNLINHYFYMFFFLGLIKNKLRRDFIKGLIIIYLLFTIIEVSFFTNFLNQFLEKNLIIGSFLIMISVLMYFYELLKSDKILNLKGSMFYWIGLGVLFFNVGFIPAYVVAEYISFGVAYRIITLVLNLIMAGCFITGFIVSKKEFNS